MKLFYFLLPLLLFSPAHSHPDEQLGWSYNGDNNGQDQWAYLDKKYRICATGIEQSPIDITRTIATSPDASLEQFYGISPVNLRFTRYAPTVVVKENNYVVDNGQSYRLSHITLRSPSEHTVRGKFWVGEIQLLHVNLQGEPLIVSLLVDIGAASPELNKILGLIPTNTDDILEAHFNPGALLPEDTGYYAYNGSLTSPDCSEGVRWRIIKQPITISKVQLKRFASLTGRNARQTSPIYTRDVLDSN